jgi:hypothetical protein
MTESVSPATRGTSAVIEPETVSPYLHDRGRILYNPLTGVSIP